MSPRFLTSDCEDCEDCDCDVVLAELRELADVDGHAALAGRLVAERKRDTGVARTSPSPAPLPADAAPPPDADADADAPPCEKLPF